MRTDLDLDSDSDSDSDSDPLDRGTVRFARVLGVSMRMDAVSSYVVSLDSIITPPLIRCLLFPSSRTGPTYEWDIRSIRGASYTLLLYQCYLERADNIRIITLSRRHTARVREPFMENGMSHV
jgi:hypothetical protein